MIDMERDDRERLSPLGLVMPFAGNDIPRGWMLCDGTAVSRSIYDALFKVIGTIHGDGDGEKTFNLPDLQPLAPGVRYIIYGGNSD
jgi:microcystin-dependent protein